MERPDFVKDQQKIANNYVIAVFICFLAFSLFGHLLTKDQEYSFTERRELAELQNPNLQVLLNSGFADDFERYALDQFPFRESFRKINSISRLSLFRQMDINNIFITTDGIYKIEEPLRPDSVKQSARLINEICQSLLKESRIYYALIPEKNYYLPEPGPYPVFDYDKLAVVMKQNIETAQEIDLIEQLDAASYYRTDLHWDQSRLNKVVSKLMTSMGRTRQISDDFPAGIYETFYGSWHGQAAVNYPPDRLTWLSNKNISSASAYYHYEQKYGSIYMPQALSRPDAYDFFLDGPQPLVTIEIQDAEDNSDKTLYLFRDSYGSSLAPLLLAYYDRIILIDLRYVSAAHLASQIEFLSKADVLFLYSAQTINNSNLLRR